MFFLMFVIQTFASAYFKSNLPLKLLPLLMIVMVPVDMIFECHAYDIYDLLHAILDSLRYMIPMVVAYVYGWYVGIKLREEHDTIADKDGLFDDDDFFDYDDDDYDDCE